MAKTEKKPSTKSDPVETRVRQLLTEVLLDMMDGEGKAADRATIVDECMSDYGDALILNAEGFLALTMHDALEDE